MKAEETTLAEAKEIFKRISNREMIDKTDYAIRLVDGYFKEKALEEEAEVVVKFLGKHYNCGKWRIDTGETKILPKSVVASLMDNYPGQWEIIKDQKSFEDDKPKLSRLHKGETK